jgi:hypothetical protein
MGRTGLTNFVIWALATVLLAYFLAPRDDLALVALGSLGVAWLTRFWPEALGVAAGAATVLLFSGLSLGAGAIAAASFVTWLTRGRRPAQAASPAPGVPPPPPPPAANGTSTPLRLTVTMFLGAFALLVIDGFVTLGFGFTCQSDTTHATPGSDRAAWCDLLGKHDVAWLVLLGPPGLALLFGLYAAWRRDARWVLIAMLAGFALVIAVHVPDFVLSNAAP